MAVGTKRPADELHAMSAPTDLVEWVRKLPLDGAARRAWVDAPRADWVPYLAVLRGIPHDTILRATCEVAADIAASVLFVGIEAPRIHAVLRAGAEHGKLGLATADADLHDLRLAMIDWGERSSPPTWMFWANLVLDLARASGRGNPIVGLALTMKRLATARGRPAHTDLVARLRDKLTIG